MTRHLLLTMLASRFSMQMPNMGMLRSSSWNAIYSLASFPHLACCSIESICGFVSPLRGFMHSSHAWSVFPVLTPVLFPAISVPRFLSHIVVSISAGIALSSSWKNLSPIVSAYFSSVGSSVASLF